MSRNTPLIEAIDALLPQTQCGKCGFDGCLPYAEAIAEGEPINRCPPGGEATLERLAGLTGQPFHPLAEPAQSPLTAVIREAECIGCTKCLQACPVDAILGAAKRMHTVIVDECTGCELCVAPCPVDCIDLVPHPAWEAAESEADREAYLARRADLGRRRHRARQVRLARQAKEKRLERQKRLMQQRRHPGSEGGAGSNAGAGPGQQRQRRMALKAAEQAVKRTQQQLESARRRGDAQAEATAMTQLPEAERLLAEARSALEQSQST
ncbi:MAG: RnfABCDGE type electron transport complex subunit B [Halomonas sp.]|uniref:RnfABCDGE type electron transport complex subunit B n=1 Tax=Halomonas sp. TaxID=1486246 RepID=UPI003970D8C0